MPWRDEAFLTWVGGLFIAAITALVTMVFKNHYSLLKHQAWVKTTFTDSKALDKKLDEKFKPVKEQMQSQDGKIELILKHLLEQHNGNADTDKVDKS